MKVYSDDYVTIVASNKEEAAKTCFEQELGDADIIDYLEEIDVDKEKMWFPVDELPEEYHDEEKYPRKKWFEEYVAVKITLREAIKYSKEKPPYILCISASLM